MVTVLAVAVSACNRTTLKIMAFVFEIMTFATNFNVFHLQKNYIDLIRLGNRTVWLKGDEMVSEKNISAFSGQITTQQNGR
jgi:hypothetical protein